MTAQVTPAPLAEVVPLAPRRRPVVLTVPRAELVESLMDLQALAHEGMDAVGDALTAIEALYAAVQGESPRIKAIEHAVAAIYEAQVRLLNEAIVCSGRYDHGARDSG
ncbi:MAG: hypothetical protein LC798_11160 [Chloroflexi bacterium]|nr:hypothetical protein [Chloroflexota bacterium]